jgi:hypothetical protein
MTSPAMEAHGAMATPFQEWKVAHNIWTPDTPAGSQHHDSEIVEAVTAGLGTGTSYKGVRAKTPHGRQQGVRQQEAQQQQQQMHMMAAMQEQQQMAQMQQIQMMQMAQAGYMFGGGGGGGMMAPQQQRAMTPMMAAERNAPKSSRAYASRQQLPHL